MKKVYAVLIGLLMVALATSAVYALFSMTAKGATNRLEAGRVEVKVVGEPVSVGNITPGSQGEAVFEVHNVGTLPVIYTVSWETEGELFEGEHPVELWSSDSGRIKPGEVNWIAVTWNFPQQAGNEYQGASGTFMLVVNAQQDVGGYP